MLYSPTFTIKINYSCGLNRPSHASSEWHITFSSFQPTFSKTKRTDPVGLELPWQDGTSNRAKLIDAKCPAGFLFNTTKPHYSKTKHKLCILVGKSMPKLVILSPKSFLMNLKMSLIPASDSWPSWPFLAWFFFQAEDQVVRFYGSWKTSLVGGWTNPSEKYERQNRVHLPQF